MIVLSVMLYINFYHYMALKLQIFLLWLMCYKVSNRWKTFFLPQKGKCFLVLRGTQRKFLIEQKQTCQHFTSRHHCKAKGVTVSSCISDWHQGKIPSQVWQSRLCIGQYFAFYHWTTLLQAYPPGDQVNKTNFSLSACKSMEIAAFSVVVLRNVSCFLRLKATLKKVELRALDVDNNQRLASSKSPLTT